MNKSILTVIILTSIFFAHAKERNQKLVYSPLNISITYQMGNFLTYGKGDVQLHTRLGQGAELLLKSRISHKLSFDLGLHTRFFLLDQDKFRNSLSAYFSVPGYYTSILHYNSTENLWMRMSGLSFSVTGIYRFGKIRLEPYAKFNASLISYSVDSRVYLRNKDSNEYYFFQVNGQRNQFILLPAVGMAIRKNLSKAIAVQAGFECGFSIGRQLLSADYIDRQYEYNSSSLQINTPKIYVMCTAGLTFRPFKIVKKNDARYHNAAYLKRFEKND